MQKARSLFTLAFLFSIFLAIPVVASAQDADPPTRVARLNYIQGSVSYQMPGDQTWIEADPNRPLTTGNNLWVDKNSRGEVHIGSTAIRLANETGLSFLTLDDRTVQLELAQGLMEVHLRHKAGDEAFEIDTPNLSFTLDASGEYRIQTDPDGNSTVITVREGSGEVNTSGDTWELHAGQQYVFNGADQVSYDAMPLPAFDEFGDWCQSRDQRENRAVSAQYVSRDVDGYYDLDDYGDWTNVPDYGMVWVPRHVEAGWVPYHMGHWVFIAPWGWTWVDEEPWGFAPFHYGRWVAVGAGWGWVPGPVVVRPVYSPAVVGFVGGGGFSLSVSIGNSFSGVAWFPLGPRDVYVPAYHCSPRYFQTVNVTNTRVVNVTQVTNVYNTVIVNRNVTNVNYTYAHNGNAVTAVSRETFVNARPVAAAAVRVRDDEIVRARVVDNAPIAPVRGSYVSASAKVSTMRPPVPIQQRPVVVRMNPATPVPTRAGFGQPNQNNRGFDRQPQPPGQFGNNNNGPVGRVNNNPPPAPPTNPAANGRPNNNGNNAPPPPNGNANQPASNNGFHPFQPPGRNPNAGGAPTNGNNAPGNNPNRGPDNHAQPQQQPQQNTQQNQNNNDRPSMRYTPPTRAKDDMYDVHPPLNRKDAQNQPRQEQQHQEQRPNEKQDKPENHKDQQKDNRDH